MTSRPTTIENWFYVLADIWNVSDFESLPTSSPEYQALEWLSYEDGLRNELLLPLITNNNGNDDNDNESNHLRILQERYSVVALYYATNGPITWTDQYNFLSTNASICKME